MDYRQLSDPELLAEAERVRGELERLPMTLANRVELGNSYDAIGAEYERRCRPHAVGQ
jgi:hypothetical protein